MPENEKFIGPVTHQPQMTLRDHFAGQALNRIANIYDSDDDLRMAKRAYAMADAMLIIRAEE